jgi:hypothetical protein
LASDLDGIDNRACHQANEHQVKHHLKADKDSGALALCIDVLFVMPLLPNPPPTDPVRNGGHLSLTSQQLTLRPLDNITRFYGPHEPPPPWILLID